MAGEAPVSCSEELATAAEEGAGGAGGGQLGTAAVVKPQAPLTPGP